MRTKKLLYPVLGLVLTLIFSATSVLAAEFRVGEHEGGNVNVGKDEQVKNLYTAGNIVSIDGNIQKNLHAAGNVVNVNGDVENTLSAAAGTLLVKGNIGGTVHGAGGTVVIESNIADDLFIGGGNVVITKSASVGGDLIVGAGTIDIQGPIAGNVYLSGGQANINSEIGGDVKIGSVDKLKLGSGARIAGNLIYNSKKEADLETGATVLGQTEFNLKGGKSKNKTSRSKSNIAGIIFAIISLAVLAKIIAGIIVGLILVYPLKKYTEKVIKESLNNFWPNLGVGFAALILVPILGVILLVTIVGAWLAVFVGIIYGLLLLLATALASITFGSWLIKVIKKQKKYEIGWHEVVVGIILMMIVKWIPIVGWLTALAFMLISLGALYQLVYKAVKK